MPAQDVKPPILPISQALERAMEMIDGADCDIAIFLVNGALTSTKKRSEQYRTRLMKLSSNLVGVYNAKTDARWVRADLGEFYRVVA